MPLRLTRKPGEAIALYRDGARLGSITLDTIDTRGHVALLVDLPRDIDVFREDAPDEDADRYPRVAPDLVISVASRWYRKGETAVVVERGPGGPDEGVWYLLTDEAFRLGASGVVALRALCSPTLDIDALTRCEALIAISAHEGLSERARRRLAIALRSWVAQHASEGPRWADVRKLAGGDND